MRKHEINELDGRAFAVPLGKDFELEQDVTGAGHWTAKIWMYRGSSYEDWVHLIERPQGAIQFSDPLEKRKSTGKTSRHQAVVWAVERLADRHARRRKQGDPTGERGTARAGTELPLYLIPILLQQHRLLDTVGAKQAQYIMNGCHLVSAVLGGDRDVNRLSQRDIAYFYAKTTGCKSTGARLSPEELARLGLTADDLGVVIDGRRRSPVSVSTAHNNIADFRAGVGKLLGAVDAQGDPYLQYNRLLSLDIGHGPGQGTEKVTQLRAFYIMKYADAATKKWNEQKRGKAKKLTLASAGQVLRQVPVGAVRCIFAIAWYRGPRHEQVLGLRVEDYLRTQRDVRAAIRKCRPTPGQETAKPEWASIWSRYGCLFFAMEFAQKPGYDRVIPLDVILQREVDRYLRLREQQGLPPAGPLFRYLGHPRVLDAKAVREIIRLAESLARAECEVSGYDPDDVFCEGVRPMHDVRTAVANRWADMGWEHNKNSAWLGCWSTNITAGGSQDQDYKKLNPHLVMALAEGKKLSEALEESGVADAAKAQAVMEVPFD